MQPSDKELWTKCRSGDAAAWELLVHRYQKLIYAIPRRAGLNEDAASEIFQEVFATLCAKLDDITQPERLHAWLVTTARRKTWRHITREVIPERARFAAASDDDDEAAFDVPDDAPLPGVVLEQLEAQQQVREALAALDERCRTLLTLLFYQDEPPAYAVIAARAGVPEGSIGPTRARCLKKLLRLLEH